MDLFEPMESKHRALAAPLAVRMRPRRLVEFVGQEEFIGEGMLLWRMLEADRLTSLIFYGPPGTGKTTLAYVIANQTSAVFVPTHAASIGVNEIRKIIKAAQDRLAAEGQRTVLFLDEIHRFTRNQQDVLLDDVENGVVILIGATTENPYFSVNSALVSRSTIFEFKPLGKKDIIKIMQSVLEDGERGLGRFKVKITEEALDYIAIMSDGDARRAITALEVGVLSQMRKEQGDGKSDKASDMKELLFDKELAVESIQQKALVSDASGDNHYDLASALQKSMRGSDPDATVYWLARLIVGGEDPRFIARRIAICAAEDVGNADPMATVLAAAAVQISEFVGLPEAQLPLAQAAIYVACAPKSNRSAAAVWQASKDVREGRTAPVPDHLKDDHYASAKKLGRGTGYQYPHNFAQGFVPQEYIPAEFARQYYQPSDRGMEKQMAAYLEKLKEYCQKEKKGRK
ncbi:MAG: replication-associated recombination protein A [Sedimentisphaerales bacterium]|nr:replication-associated recombination protein A [Sedimentisphaerales bacterium]